MRRRRQQSCKRSRSRRRQECERRRSARTRSKQLRLLVKKSSPRADLDRRAERGRRRLPGQVGYRLSNTSAGPTLVRNHGQRQSSCNHEGVGRRGQRSSCSILEGAGRRGLRRSSTTAEQSKGQKRAKCSLAYVRSSSSTASTWAARTMLATADLTSILTSSRRRTRRRGRPSAPSPSPEPSSTSVSIGITSRPFFPSGLSTAAGTRRATPSTTTSSSASSMTRPSLSPPAPGTTTTS
mmetsp:Transcript_45625/g.97188  ORF Transcript_45625/g.97188 Transcript_45625/m.97188 type:complete len:238 (+) Transcript_45625:196-909(+)